MREFLKPHVSRSGLDRCLRRHGPGNLRAPKPKEPKPAHGSFKADEPGDLHIDIT
ncbi:IS481 family transposase, partial [Rhodovulum visakhapatnamense]|nr:IS481 family transposase [Rhodovulum visakhapatnamense]MBL3580777.1 IS481 family transposase [Rhodovulum visakhapatnamense]